MKSDFPNTPERNPGRRLFTLEEANSMVPIFTEMFAEINSLKQTVVSVVESKSATAKSNGHLIPESSEAHRDLAMVSTAAGRISELIDQINRSGAELKDLGLGLIDFPFMRNQKLVYLCWMYGEEEIGYWHDLDTGVAGRQPL